jgi:acyl carrier protein phosphodiesterase
MNYLAHLALSYPVTDLVVGNFIGDHIRNKDLDKFTREVQLGVEMHRSIDNFTDTHPASIAVREKLFKEYRHISRILVDIYYDHFLALHFETFHQKSLTLFNREITSLLQQHASVMPISAQGYLKGMKAQNWLLEYSSIAGIDIILNKMANRSGLVSLKTATKTLEQHYPFLQAQFLKFYPELLGHCESFKKEALH